MKLADSSKIYVELSFWIFFAKIEMVVAESALFHKQVLPIKDVLIFILRCFELYLSPEGLEKTFLITSFQCTWLLQTQTVNYKIKHTARSTS